MGISALEPLLNRGLHRVRTLFKFGFVPSLIFS